ASTLLVIATASFTACGHPIEAHPNLPAPPPQVPTNTPVVGRQSDRLPNGRVVTDYDVPVRSEEEHRDQFRACTLQGEGHHPAAQLTVDIRDGRQNIWDPDPTLTYCVASAFGSKKAAVVAALQQAGLDWAGAARVTFRYQPADDETCTAANEHVVFDV